MGIKFIRLILSLLFFLTILFPGRVFCADGDPLLVPGSIEITIVGTLTTGKWNADTITVPYGGTGGITFTDHGVLLGSGTGAFTATVELTDGQLLIGDTGADPVPTALTMGDGLDSTIGPGTLELDLDLKANGGLVIEATELALDVGATSITGTLAVTDGGTGLTSPADHAVIVGSGATAMTELAVGANGQLLIGSTGNDPVFADLTAGDALAATTGAGTLELDVVIADIVTMLEALVGVAKLSHDSGLSDISSDDHHAQTHTIVSHDTTGTGANLNTLTDDSMADALHRHSELSASDGTPNPSLSVDATGATYIGDFTYTANNQGEVSLFGDGTNAQPGAFYSKLKIFGGSGQTRNLELFQAVGGDTYIDSTYAALNLRTFSNDDIRLEPHGTGRVELGDGAGNNTAITSAGGFSFEGTAGMVHGEISVKDNAVPTILNSGAEVQVTVFDTNGPSNDTAPDQANNEITITVAGHYFIAVSIHVNNNAVQTHVIDVSLNKNNGARVELSNVHSHRTLTGGSGDVGSMSLSGIVDLAVDDELQIWATTDIAADRSVIFSDITLSIIQIGGT